MPVKERPGKDKHRETRAALELGDLQYPTAEELRDEMAKGRSGIYDLPYRNFEYETNDDDDRMEVASESGSLRTIFAIIDNR